MDFGNIIYNNEAFRVGNVYYCKTTFCDPGCHIKYKVIEKQGYKVKVEVTTYDADWRGNFSGNIHKEKGPFEFRDYGDFIKSLANWQESFITEDEFKLWII
jgi:hypothetical protein